MNIGKDTMKRSLYTMALLAWIMVQWSSCVENGVMAPGAKVEKLAGDFEFAEGPTCDPEGNVFFTDQPNDRILKWSVEGKLSTFKQPAGRANGMYFDAGGNLIACADERNELWSIAPDGKVTVILSQYHGKPLNGPNDVWVRLDGAIYFTDPFYKRPWWKHDRMPQDGQDVYFLSPDRRELVSVIDNLKQPNGIIGTPDGKALYVSDIGDGKTYQFDIMSNGRLANKTLLCEQGSDGMTLDNEGNLYLTGDGVLVFDKDGTADRAHQGARALDRERQLRRQGQTDALHYRKQGALRSKNAGQGGQRSKVTFIRAAGPGIRKEPLPPVR